MNKVKKIIFGILAIGMVLLFLFFYKNYQRNQAIKKANTIITFSDKNSKFIKEIVNDKDLIEGEEILKEVQKINKLLIQEFLISTKRKVVFNSSNKDTIIISLKDTTSFSHTSLFSEDVNKEFNTFIVPKIAEFLKNKKLDRIELYTIVPKEGGLAPPIPGMLHNLDSIGNGTD